MSPSLQKSWSLPMSRIAHLIARSYLQAPAHNRIFPCSNDWTKIFLASIILISHIYMKKRNIMRIMKI